MEIITKRLLVFFCISKLSNVISHSSISSSKIKTVEILVLTMTLRLALGLPPAMVKKYLC